jgi:Domain of unknown function (DUF4864)
MEEVMAKLVAALIALLALAGPAAAEDGAPLAPADAAAIRQVIEEQIQAFKRDDGNGAFAYASPMIQGRFRTPENFMAMVRAAYPQVYRPREVEFQDLADSAEGPIQEVIVVGPDGVPVMALYVMEKQADGSWRINGCYLTRISDQSA